MPTAIAAPPSPARSSGLPTSADNGSASDLSSTSGVDFAALLLGQQPADLALNLVAEGETSGQGPLTDTLSAPLDPVLLLASMGISGVAISPIAQNGRPTDTDQLTAGSGLPSLPEMGIALAATADSALKPELTTKPKDVELAVRADATGPQIALPTAEMPAKLAGFAQKLADATQGLADVTTPTPLQVAQQQLANAAQVGNNTTTSAQHAIETVQLGTPLKDQAWPAEFGQKVVWLANQDKQSAQITLNPPDLGPIELSLKIKNDHATVAFTSANAEVREAIELAIPRLREMLAGVGVELGQTNVSAESFRQQTDGNASNQGNQSNRGAESDTKTAISELMRGGATLGNNAKRGNGLVDTFA